MAITGLLFQLPMYLTNTWYTGHLPFNTNKIYDRYGKRYQNKRVIDDRANFVLEKFKTYSVFPKSLCENMAYSRSLAALRHSWIYRQIRLLFRMLLRFCCPHRSLPSSSDLGGPQRCCHSETAFSATHRCSQSTDSSLSRSSTVVVPSYTRGLVRNGSRRSCKMVARSSHMGNPQYRQMSSHLATMFCFCGWRSIHRPLGNSEGSFQQ
jgi:hypothetical protein